MPPLAQYYSTNPTGCSLWGSRSWTYAPFLAKNYIHGKEVARFDLAALFAFQRPVTEYFNRNLAEVFRPSDNTTRINLLHKEL